MEYINLVLFSQHLQHGALYYTFIYSPVPPHVEACYVTAISNAKKMQTLYTKMTSNYKITYGHYVTIG
jgi:hypothetical protein